MHSTLGDTIGVENGSRLGLFDLQDTGYVIGNSYCTNVFSNTFYIFEIKVSLSKNPVSYILCMKHVKCKLMLHYVQKHVILLLIC